MVNQGQGFGLAHPLTSTRVGKGNTGLSLYIAGVVWRGGLAGSLDPRCLPRRAQNTSNNHLTGGSAGLHTVDKRAVAPNRGFWGNRGSTWARAQQEHRYAWATQGGSVSVAWIRAVTLVPQARRVASDARWWWRPLKDKPSLRRRQGGWPRSRSVCLSPRGGDARGSPSSPPLFEVANPTSPAPV